MYVHITDVSSTGMVMYRVEIYDWNCESTEDSIHEWIDENCDSYDCLIHGRMYLFEDVENAIAIKWKWM